MTADLDAANEVPDRGIGVDEVHAGAYVAIDWQRLRAETRGIHTVAHLNNAGAALPPDPVVDAMVKHLNVEAEIGSYEAAEAAADVVADSYRSLATLLSCDLTEIALTDSASRAWSLAFASFGLRENDRILASPYEYGSNWLSLLHAARRTGAVVDLIPTSESGEVSAAALAAMIDDRVKLIAVTHVPSNGGLVNPVAEIGRVAREANVPYLLDACQSVGHLPISVDEIRCDILAGSGRKYLRGPRGTGFLYIRREMLERLEPAWVGLDGGRWIGGRRYEYAPDTRRFETWESNVAAGVGLSVALRYALEVGVEQAWPRIQQLADALRERLGAIRGVRVADLGTERCGIVSFLVEGVDANVVYERLIGRRVNTWVALPNTACVDMERRRLSRLIRASVHYYNTPDEGDLLCDIIEEVAREHDNRTVTPMSRPTPPRHPSRAGTDEAGRG